MICHERQGRRLAMTHTHTHTHTKPVIVCPPFAYSRWLLFNLCKFGEQEKTLWLSAVRSNALFDSWLICAKTKRNCHILIIPITASDYLCLETGRSPPEHHSARCMREQYPGRSGRRRSSSGLVINFSCTETFICLQKREHIFIMEDHFSLSLIFYFISTLFLSSVSIHLAVLNVWRWN